MQRYTPSPLARKDLPPLDFVLISHDHYDHLEHATIRFLRDRNVPFVVPLGVGARLRGWGIPPERRISPLIFALSKRGCGGMPILMPE